MTTSATSNPNPNPNSNPNPNPNPNPNQAGLSVTALLEHYSGLSEVLPPDTKLAQLCDPAHMAACVAAAAPDASAAAVAGGPRHEGAAWGWALHGLLEAATGLPLR